MTRPSEAGIVETQPVLKGQEGHKGGVRGRQSSEKGAPSGVVWVDSTVVLEDTRSETLTVQSLTCICKMWVIRILMQKASVRV